VAVSGLLAAARDYRALQDGNFRVYAVDRIRGAIVEELQGKNMSATDTKKATAATVDEVFHEAMHCYEKRMQEFVETFNRTSNQTIDLFERTLGVYQATSVPDAQRRVQDLIESSLSTLRVNVHSALNTNAQVVASWKELVGRFGPAVK
jgi:DNA-directed RNA polymerase specialized sigma subunit